MSSMEEDYKTALGFLLEFGSDGYLPCPDPDGSGDIAYQAAVRINCLLYTSPSPRDLSTSRMPSSA